MGWSAGRHVDHPCGGANFAWPDLLGVVRPKMCFSLARIACIGVQETMLSARSALLLAPGTTKCESN